MGYSNYNYQDNQGMTPRSFGVKVSPDDQIVTILNGNTILTKLSLQLNGTKLSLIGKDDIEISNVEIPNADWVSNVSYDEIKKDLVISLSSLDGTTQELRVSLRDLVDVYTASDGIAVENKAIRIKLNETESYLNVNADGLAVDIDGLTTKLDETFATDTDVTQNSDKISRLENIAFDKSNISVSLPEDAIGVDTKVLSEKLVIAELNKKQNVGNYAEKTELTSEVDRATAAETELSSKLEQYKNSSVVTVEVLGDPSEGAVKTYVIKQNGTKVGVPIDIPKDMVVQNGVIVKGSWDRDRTTFTPSDEGADIALKLTIGNGNPVYIDVKQLVDVYTPDNGINISDLNAISVKIDPTSENNYLSVGTDGLKISGVDTTIASKVSTAINNLNASKSGTSADNHVKVDVGVMKGLVSSVAVTCQDIASAAELSAINKAYFDKSNVAETMPSDGTGVDTKVLSEKLVVTELKKKQDVGDYATKSQLSTKQDNLVSGTNIKTINGETILGNGNIQIAKVNVINDLTTGGIDKALSAEQGKSLKGLVDGKQNKGDYALRAELANKQEKILYGAFANKPVEPVMGEMFFCTDKQTTEGQTNGIMIIWNGTAWTDMLGRAIS